MDKIWLALITGLTTGGISCFAIQGGLLASSLAQSGPLEKVSKSDKYIHVGVFIFFKLLVYTLLGFILGLIGSSFIVAPKVQSIFQFLVGLFLLATAGRLLNLHPIFRYFVIQPPAFIYRFAKKHSQTESFFAPAFLGLLTILLPCGITQAMMLVAIGSGSPLVGAGIMFAFVLGTSPVFFLLGAVSVELLKKKAFTIIAAVIILILGLISLNSGLALWGSSFTFQNLFQGRSGSSANVNQGVQKVTINITPRGYLADVTTLKVGVPVELTLVTNNIYSCARSFSIPSFNIVKNMPPTGSQVIKFTPKKVGRLTYTCTMGMYTGYFDVVK
jgi:sulfite exporter TauE/SafE